MNTDKKTGREVDEVVRLSASIAGTGICFLKKFFYLCSFVDKKGF